MCRAAQNMLIEHKLSIKCDNNALRFWHVSWLDVDGVRHRGS